MEIHMKRILFIICLTGALVAGCKSEKKITAYNDVYAEKPVTVYIAPIQDNATRKEEKYQKDIDYNTEINNARNYLFECLQKPLSNQGYYVIGKLASEQIAQQEKQSAKELKSKDIKRYAQYYGIDAILVTTLHRWVEKNGQWIVFIEYTLRSTKSNNDLLHTWVKATKMIPTDLKGDPIALKSDKAFANRYNMSNGSAQRCILVEQVSDYVLRDLPISSTKRQFEQDRYKKANSAYFDYIFNADGDINIEASSMESFEQDCFVE